MLFRSLLKALYLDPGHVSPLGVLGIWESLHDGELIFPSLLPTWCRWLTGIRFHAEVVYPLDEFRIAHSGFQFRHRAAEFFR